MSLKTSLTGKGNAVIEGSLKLSVRIVKNSNEIDTPKDQDLGLLKPFLDEMKQFSQDQKGEFEILKANSINANYVKKITPVVLITNYLHDVFNWKSPVHTIIFGMAVTLGTLYVQYILAFSLLLFYINTPFFLRILMKMPHKKKKKEGNVFERNKAKIMKFKRNMTHIQETQKDYLKKYEYVKKLVWSEDRTLLIETVVGLRKFVILMLPFIIFINPQVLFLVFFWVMLIKNSAYGKSLVEEVSVKFDSFNIHLNRKIDGFVTKYRLFPVPPANQPDLRKVSDNQISQKTFVIYENQRWWIGKGWTDLLGFLIFYYLSLFLFFLIKERPKFSDIDGILALDFKKVILPEPEEEWIWESEEWKVEISDKTDAEGWEYAYDFKYEFHPQNSKFDYARRKKWVRSCTRASQNK